MLTSVVTHMLLKSLNKWTLDLISSPRQMTVQMCSSHLGMFPSDMGTHEEREMQIL